jgi:hypothetical protein
MAERLPYSLYPSHFLLFAAGIQYIQKKGFVVSMYGGYLEAKRMVEKLFIVPILVFNLLQAYIQKKRFVVSMYGGYLEAQRMVERLFIVPRLITPAWHLCLRVRYLFYRFLYRPEISRTDLNALFMIYHGLNPEFIT